MMKMSIFWQRLLSFLVLTILPLSTIAPRAIVPLFLVFFLSISAYWLVQQTQINFKSIFNSIQITHGLIILGFFLLWSLLSVVWSIDLQHTLYFWTKLLLLLLAGIGLSLMFQKLDKNFKSRLLLALMLGLIITNAWLMIEIKTQGKFLSLNKGEVFWLTYYNKALSLEVMLIWPILAYLNRFFKASPDQEVKYLALIFQLILIFQTAFVILNLEATTVKIAFIIGALVGICSLIKERIIKWLLLSTCAAIFMAAPLLYKQVLTPSTVANITHEFIEKPSFYHRLYIWRFVSDEILLKPWTGWGLDTSRHKHFAEKKILSDEIKKETPFLKVATLDLLPLHPHNLPLQLWLELGFPGVFLILYLISLIIFAIPRLFKEKFNRSAAYASFSSALIVNIGSYGIWQSWWVSGLWLTIIFVKFLESGND